MTAPFTAGLAARAAPVRDEALPGVRGRIVAIFALLAVVNLAAWAWALLTFHAHPVLLGTALLAYAFGLRHAVDADHIAAIDNVTRKLMQGGERPVAVGFFFSLGHSTVVVLMSVAVALAASTVDAHFQQLRKIGAEAGTGISAAFLFAIAIANIFALYGLVRAFRRARAGPARAEEGLDPPPANGGLLARIFRPLLGLISQSWHMYPLGFLFGLGFDTATEIAVLGLSAAGVAHGLPIGSILVFPALFTAAMVLLDTADGVLMLGAYGWAFINPIRKLYYNMTITAVSVVIALVVGGVEALAVIADRLGLDHGAWGAVAVLGKNFGVLGFVVIGFFVACWVVSFTIYGVGGYDTIGARTGPGPVTGRPD